MHAAMQVHVLERDRSVLRRRAGPHPQRRFGVLEQVLGAGEMAGDVRADGHDVATDRLALEHLVEARRPEHLGRLEVEDLGEMGHRVVGEIAVLLLCEVQQGNQRGPRPGVPADDLARRAPRWRR